MEKPVVLSSSPSADPSLVFVVKEHMFDKVVTPSDVGKLNRLVIPKQYAEKYFPLDPEELESDRGGAAAAAASSPAETKKLGLLLSFEDRGGKPWRFRYSYWNSSQSYVITKGWSRFVKEKGLGAGDTVSFSRGSGNPAARRRLFIDWKRRQPQPARPHLRGFTNTIPVLPSGPLTSHPFSSIVACGHHWRARTALYNVNWLPPAAAAAAAPKLEVHPGPPAGTTMPPSVTLGSRSKRLRLFGVNLDFSEPLPE